MVSLIKIKILDVDMKDCSKKLSKKFATAASIKSETVIEMQGDLADDVFDFLLENYPDKVFFIFYSF